MADRSFKIVGVASLAAWLWAGPPPARGAQPADRTRAEALARRAGERVRMLQREGDALAAEERMILADVKRLEVERDRTAAALTALEAAVEDTHRRLNETATTLLELERAAEAQRPALATRMVEIYKLGRAGYTRLLLNVESLRALGRAYRVIAAVARLDRERVHERVRTLEALRAARIALMTRSGREARLRDEAQTARVALDRTIAARDAAVRAIDARRDANAQLSGELQQAQQKLQATLAQLGAGRTAVLPTMLPIRPFRGALDWPVAGRVTARFRPVKRAAARNGQAGAHALGNGIEIAAGAALPVRAVHEGRVSFADVYAGLGNVVILDHGDQAVSVYGHLGEVRVKAGATIDRGDPVGTVGEGPAGAPGLFFELRIDGQPVDPVQWLRRSP